MHTSLIPLILLLAAIACCCNAFTYTSLKRKSGACAVTQLSYTSSASASGGNNYQLTNNNDVPSSPLQTKPNWVPMELIEVISDDLNISQELFMQNYADIEA